MPNSATYTALISLHLSNSDPTKARAAFREMLLMDIPVVTRTYNVLLAGLAACDDTAQSAIDLFEEMEKQKDAAPDEESYEAVVAACGRVRPAAVLRAEGYVAAVKRSKVLKMSVGIYNALLMTHAASVSTAATFARAAAILNEIEKGFNPVTPFR